MAKMNEQDLLQFLEEEASQAFHFVEGEIASDRVKAMRSYMREPYGTEEDGRSAVVASDVFDAVEGMLPDLIEVFTSSDKAVVFDAVGPEDVEAAEQVTNACNYVFYKQNSGFFVLYSAFKDGLMLKTGGVKWYYEKKRTPTFTRYRGVDEMQLAVFLTTNPKAEVVEQEEAEPTPEELAMHAEASQQFVAAGLEPPPLPVRLNVKIKTIEEKGGVRVVALPPDELQVSRRQDSILLDECPYVAHVVEKTLSDIHQMGYADVSVEDMKSAQNEEHTADKDYRETQRGGKWGWWQDDNELDDSMVRGYLREEYVLVDYDGDGIAERRRVLRLGQKVLDNEECSHVPIAAWTPYILTHQFNGLSVADLVEDFQRIHTEVLRAQLDNLALANTQETVVLTSAQGAPMANIDDLLNRRPGGILREHQAGAIRPYQERWQGIEAMPMLEQLQVSKENRTGYTRYSQGLDANSLNKTATGVQMIMNASQKRMKLMARIAAEALVAPMFRGIFKTLTDSDMEEISFQLNGKFVRYNPQEWRDQFNMTINVGIGTGDVQQQQQFLMQIAQAQAMAMGSPLGGKLVTPKNIYNAQARLAENAGFKNPGEFWTDPGDGPIQAPPPPPDPKVLLEQEKLKQSQQKDVATFQADQQKSASEMAWEREKFAMQMAFDAEQAERDRQFKLQMEALKASGAQAPTPADQDEQQPSQTDALLAQVLETMQGMTQMLTAPRQIVRDETTGQAIGIDVGGVVRPIERGPDGRAISLQ
ncbi:MAG TPA: hypothetical protein VMA55_20185 [Acidovorax sp.]|nr:hypothetical protein [Acidovorax sp.]